MHTLKESDLIYDKFNKPDDPTCDFDGTIDEGECDCEFERIKPLGSGTAQRIIQVTPDPDSPRPRKIHRKNPAFLKWGKRYSYIYPETIEQRHQIWLELQKQEAIYLRELKKQQEQKQQEQWKFLSDFYDVKIDTFDKAMDYSARLYMENNLLWELCYRK